MRRLRIVAECCLSDRKRVKRKTSSKGILLEEPGDRYWVCNVSAIAEYASRP